MDATRIAHAAVPLRQGPEDFDGLLERIGDARVVLLGEGSHGTHEFYRDRARITKRLIREKGFAAVAVEGDWPDCARVHRWIHGRDGDGPATDSLEGFRRFPQWMWRNTDVLDLAGWLRAWNEHQDPARRIGFYGLDLYSLHTSIEAVVRYLQKADPKAAALARERFSCFDVYGEDPQSYGWSAALGESGCEEEVVRQLVDLRRQRVRLATDGVETEDDFFDAERNAVAIAGAERYYRTMFVGDEASWNLRDTHMAETLDSVLRHLDRRFGRAKAVVWAHNSHIGDARATGMARRGELNLGQLARDRFGRHDVVIVGFTTFNGTVTAANDWGSGAERMRVRDALPESWERAFHDTGFPAFLLDTRALDPRDERLQRFIGVVYRAATERRSHYFETRIAEQYDAVIHVDETRAVEPLERAPRWEGAEQPETFPSGL